MDNTDCESRHSTISVKMQQIYFVAPRVFVCATILLPIAFPKLLLKLLYAQYVKRILNKIARNFKETYPGKKSLPQSFFQEILG